MTGSDVHLTLEFQEHPYGRCQAILTDEDGNVLLDQIYKNKNSARASVRARLKKEGLGEAVITRIQPGDTEPDEDEDEATSEPEQTPTPAPSAPTDRWLLKLRREAQKALDEALALRVRAERLELEHKRLTAAADVLEGPEA
jgi:hypothetical protein